MDLPYKISINFNAREIFRLLAKLLYALALYREF